MTTELRVYLLVEDLQPQFAAYMSTPTRGVGYPPFTGENSLFIEVAPALAIHRVIDLALKVAPDMEPGILFTERQFGLLELHSPDKKLLEAAGSAILEGIAVKAEDQLAPATLYIDLIENIADQHAILLDRMRNASMVLPGDSLLVYEISPALFATVAANEAEKAAPEITIVDIQMMGATGRVFLSGSTSSLGAARGRIRSTLDEIVGRK